MKSYRLNPTDSTAIKFDKLCKAADELGLTLVFSPLEVTVHDAERPGVIFYVKELDEPTYSHTAAVNQLPPCTETRIIYNKDD